MATGVAHRLSRSGFRVMITEIPRPLAVRRAVCFCEAVYDTAKTVEGITARRIRNPEDRHDLWAGGEIPILVDPAMECLDGLRPPVIVDAVMAKFNTGLRRDMAPLTIGLGPGFVAPGDVHLAIETMRGHYLGRLIYDGAPAPNTGIPGEIGGKTEQRVLRAPWDGVISTERELGDKVAAGEVIARVEGEPVAAKLDGVVRGLIRPETFVKKGLKVGDVDPRGEVAYLTTISEKARALGGAVLEGILAAYNR